MGQERTKGSGSSWGKKGQRDQAAMGIKKDEGMMAAVECKIKSDLRQQLGERRIRGFRGENEDNDLRQFEAAVWIKGLEG